MITCHTSPERAGLWASDLRVVVNPEQARRFLDAVGTRNDDGRRLKAFFALMYYAGLRPEDARPRSGSRWINTGEIRERVPLNIELRANRWRCRFIARWADHSVTVLLTVYAKAIDGAESETLERIWQTTRRPED